MIKTCQSHLNKMTMYIMGRARLTMIDDDPFKVNKIQLGFSFAKPLCKQAAIDIQRYFRSEDELQQPLAVDDCDGERGVTHTHAPSSLTIRATWCLAHYISRTLNNFTLSLPTNKTEACANINKSEPSFPLMHEKLCCGASVVTQAKTRPPYLKKEGERLDRSKPRKDLIPQVVGLETTALFDRDSEKIGHSPLLPWKSAKRQLCFGIYRRQVSSPARGGSIGQKRGLLEMNESEESLTGSREVRQPDRDNFTFSSD
ncbi:hypothetical protein C0J52_21115 [Blattella germanica]|nr:hypothetical protein C0J52_21115 [Blattella germanica]